MSNVRRAGSRRNAWLRREMLLKFRSTVLSFGKSMLYMLLRVEIMLLERTKNSKEGATCLTSLGTTLRLDLSTISDFKLSNGFRLIFPHVPLQLLRRKDSNVPPIALKSGAWCRLCNDICMRRRSGSPPNASGSICFNESTLMFIVCKKIRNLSIYVTGSGMLF